MVKSFLRQVWKRRVVCENLRQNRAKKKKNIYFFNSAGLSSTNYILHLDVRRLLRSRKCVLNSGTPVEVYPDSMLFQREPEIVTLEFDEFYPGVLCDPHEKVDKEILHADFGKERLVFKNKLQLLWRLILNFLNKWFFMRRCCLPQNVLSYHLK